MKSKQETFKIEPIPKMRRFALDAGYLGRRRHIVHGLIEVDVSEARKTIKVHKFVLLIIFENSSRAVMG